MQNLSDFTIKGLLVEQIRREIILGQLPPGTKLRLGDLAQKFNVSTQPIREALSDLEAEGLVQVMPRRGSIVTTLTPDEVVDIYETRATLEAMATRLAVPLLTDETLQILTQIVDDMETHFGNVAEMVDLNTQFHRHLCFASQRTHLCDIIFSLRNRTSHYVHAFIHMVEQEDDMHKRDEHREILALCRTGNADGAAAQIYEHVITAGIGIRHYVEQHTMR